MKTKRILVVLVLLAAVLAVGFAAGTKEVKPAGPVTIELWSSLSGSKAKVFDIQVAEYNASQSEVKVNVIHQGGYSILRQKIAAAANAKNMPTLLICDYLDVPWYSQLGLLKSLDDLLPKATLDDYYPAMLADLTYEGELYALPYNRSTQGFFVNNDLIRKAGIEKPATTWDEFKKDAKTMKNLGKEYYYGYAFFHQFLFDAIAYTWGSEIGTPDGTVRLNSPATVEMMTYFQQLFNDDLLLMQPVLVGGFEEQNGAFLDGRVASVFQTTSFIPTAEKLLKYDWSFNFIPAGKGGHAVTIGGGNFGIASQASKASTDAAIQFLNHMAKAETIADFFMQTGNLPTRKSVMELAEVKEFLANRPAYTVMIDQLAYGKAAPSTTKNLRDVFNRVNDMISRIILNNEHAKKVLDEYTALFQAEFDEAKSFGEFIY
ncbi:MAG: ABC transporter substrate-binding protein [Sphaerochaeta sp.]|nr:ABC transporter substrate-binding protein [Sphaerochaeta sp.]